MNYARWGAWALRAHFRSDNSQVYLPKVKGTVAYGQFIQEYNPGLGWDEARRRLFGEVWCEVGDAVDRGATWFSQQKAIPIFMKRSVRESGFMGPVCLCRPAYFADLTTNPPAVQKRDSELKAVLAPEHPGYRDIGGYLILEYKGPAAP